MARGPVFMFVVLLHLGIGAGCSRKPAADVAVAPESTNPAPPPATLEGKWRLELKDGTASRISIYHFKGDGRLEVETEITTPERRIRDLAKSAITKVEGETMTIVDLSHTGDDGKEDVIPPDRHRPRTVRYRIRGDELEWTRVDAAPESRPLVMKRVKE